MMDINEEQLLAAEICENDNVKQECKNYIKGLLEAVEVECVYMGSHGLQWLKSLGD